MLKPSSIKNIKDETINVFFCQKNERIRLPFFLEYYRNLGVGQFFAVDNNSDDGSFEYLNSQHDVHVFWTDDSYKDSNAGRDWTDELTNLYGVGQWCLTLDVDEFFVYPFMENCTLPQYCKYLDLNSFQGVYCIFLDHYSNQVLSETTLFNLPYLILKRNYYNLISLK